MIQCQGNVSNLGFYSTAAALLYLKVWFIIMIRKWEKSDILCLGIQIAGAFG